MCLIRGIPISSMSRILDLYHCYGAGAGGSLFYHHRSLLFCIPIEKDLEGRFLRFRGTLLLSTLRRVTRAVV